MQYWFTPFSLADEARAFFQSSGVERWPEERLTPESPCLLVYDRPDQLIFSSVQQPESPALHSQMLLDGYRFLLDWTDQNRQPLLSFSALRHLGAQGLKDWLAGTTLDTSVGAADNTFSISPLLASVTLSLIDAEPRLLNAYLDLELRATLFGRQPDVAYRDQLRNLLHHSDTLLDDASKTFRSSSRTTALEGLLAAKTIALESSHAELEQTGYRLRQTQQELERYVRADRVNHEQLQASGRELETLRQRPQARETELERLLEAKASELREAREEADLALLMVHDLQETLEESLRANSVQQRQLNQTTLDLDQLRQAYEAQGHQHAQDLADLRQRADGQGELEELLSQRDVELKEAREEADILLMHLHQVQEDHQRSSLAAEELRTRLNHVSGDLEQTHQALSVTRVEHQRELAQLLETQNAQRRSLQQEHDAQYRALIQSQMELKQQLMTKDSELRRVQEESALTQTQLHQVEEDLNHFLLADCQKQLQLEANAKELEALRQTYESQQAKLKQSLSEHETMLHDVKGERELTTLQLEQVQEELEIYFHKTLARERLVQAQTEQLQRAQLLLTKLAATGSYSQQNTRSIAVDVLPPLTSQNEQASLQTQALLHTYAASLRRANALLERVKRL